MGLIGGAGRPVADVDEQFEVYRARIANAEPPADVRAYAGGLRDAGWLEALTWVRGDSPLSPLREVETRRAFDLVKELDAARDKYNATEDFRALGIYEALFWVCNVAV